MPNRGPSSKKLSKKETNRFPIKFEIAGLILSLYLRFLFYTSRKQYVDAHHLTDFFETDQPIILISWHNRNILSVFGYLSQCPSGREFFPMASASKDGSIASAAMKWLGVTCIRGSSSKGGSRALRSMLRLARGGHDLGITPDGPRGPKYRVQAGVITTAKLTGAPIIPMAYCAKRKKILNSWDSMIVPYPFNSLKYVYGKPIAVPRDCPENEVEAYRVKVEKEMLRVTGVSEEF